jgi:flavodoxin
VVDIAKREQISDDRPKLMLTNTDLNQYDVIILGYPNWWSTMPMAVFTFLEKFDFSGKMILPYCTHEGSGLGHSVRDISRECPTARVIPWTGHPRYKSKRRERRTQNLVKPGGLIR